MESDWEGLWERNIRPNMGGSKMTTFFAIWQCTFCRPRGYMKTGHHHAVKKEGVVGRLEKRNRLAMCLYSEEYGSVDLL